MRRAAVGAEQGAAVAETAAVGSKEAQGAAGFDEKFATGTGVDQRIVLQAEVAAAQPAQRVVVDQGAGVKRLQAAAGEFDQPVIGQLPVSGHRASAPQHAALDVQDAGAGHRTLGKEQAAAGSDAEGGAALYLDGAVIDQVDSQL